MTAAATICYFAIRCVIDERIAAEGRAAELRMERANADLQDAIAGLQDKLGAVTRDRAQIQRQVAGLGSQSGVLRGLLNSAEEKLRSLVQTHGQLSQQIGAIREQHSASEEASSSRPDQIAQLTRTLAQIRQELRDAQVQRATLMARLSKAEADAQATQSDRLKASNERDRLRARVSALEQQLSLRTRRGSPTEVASVPVVPPAANGALPAANGVAPGANGMAPAASAAAAATTATYPPTRHGLNEAERVLASAGLDVERLLAKFGTGRAEGGPFVPPPKGGVLPDQLGTQKLLALERLAKALPIAVPVGSYRLTSPFGIRHDPFNGREEFHTGVDLSAPFMTPVYATAPGTVTYAGWRQSYGKVVEIDHGNGISTRYAHLHRYTVLVGERVRAHTQIGFIGTSGRSTGPHLHYEVLVNGEPQNPEKFFSLAHLIPAAAR